MHFITIQDEDTLASYCHQAKKAKFLAIDTEFVRTKTLFPKLGLLQIFDGEQLALIDPLKVLNLSSFWNLLEDKRQLKLLHACSEDIEVFLTQAQCKPANLLDSQIAMSFLGHGLSMGYAAMVKYYREIELDKSESRTDWLRRPLSQRQLEYAAADVFHLWHMGDTILEELDKTAWHSAALEESENIVERKFKPVIPDRIYRDIKGAWKLSPKQLLRLKHLCDWRYNLAVKRDVPISFIAKDATLLQLSEKNPKSVGAMAGFSDIEILDVRHQGKSMLSVLKKCQGLLESDFPDKVIRIDEQSGYKQIFKQVKNQVAETAKQKGIAAEFLASKKQINQFLSYKWQINTSSDFESLPDLLKGWRKVLIGNALLELVEKNSVPAVGY